MEPILNSNLQKSGLPGYVVRSFKNSGLRHILIPDGTTLFTMSLKPNFHGNSTDGVPYFWSPYKKFKQDRGFQARLDLAKKGTGDPRAVFAELSAFYGKRAGGRYAIVAKLMRPVYGFFGPIRRQGRSAAQVSAAIESMGADGAEAANTIGASSNLIGFQIYIPGLQDGVHIKRVKKHDLLSN